MKRYVAILVSASALVIAAVLPASARPPHKPSPRAHVYRVVLKPVAVGPYGLIPKVKGSAQLVDGKRNDKLSVHIKGLQPGTTYPWHLHKAKAAGNPCDPASGAADATPAPGWTFKKLKANRAGHANATGRSTTFKPDAGDVYYVDVHLPSGEPIACGVIFGKVKKPKAKHKGQHRPPVAHGHGHEDHGGPKGKHV